MADSGREAGRQIVQGFRGRVAMARRNRQTAPADEPQAAAVMDAPDGDERLLTGDEQPAENGLEEALPQFCTACAAERVQATSTADDGMTAAAAEGDTEEAGVIAEHRCFGCETPICEAHRYREQGGRLNFCYACADTAVGICADCGILHATPCRECGKKVCGDCARKVVENWGWGGSPGQGGVTSWFPFIRTYCQEHDAHRIDKPKPAQKRFVGFDGSSPEW